MERSEINQRNYYQNSNNLMSSLFPLSTSQVFEIENPEAIH